MTTMLFRRRARTLVVVMSMAMVAACGSGSTPRSSAKAPPTTLGVLAASSLTEAFTEMGRRYGIAAPGTKVELDFESSSDLARKIGDGAPADVFVSADAPNMDKVVSAGNAVTPRVVARNRLELLVAKGNPKHLTGLADLDRPGVLFVLCAPQVPCGRLGALALRKAGVAAEPASLEANVKAVVSKVTLGEADAGIVYVTDVLASGGSAEGVDIAAAADADLEAVYPAAVVRQSTHPDDARRFIDFVLSPEGQAVLARFGFRGP